jgi:hypothetical protein
MFTRYFLGQYSLLDSRKAMEQTYHHFAPFLFDFWRQNLLAPSHIIAYKSNYHTANSLVLSF